jgi:Fur family transcriptional regulator, iron response regulator
MKQKQYSTEEIEKKLLEKGVQPTLQRIALFRYVLCEADHPTADHVFEWAQKNLAKISQATVYNTLGVLTDSGLLKTFKFSHTEKLVYDCNTEDHFHFFDEKSGRVLDVEPSSVKVTVDLPKKYKVKGMDIILKGEIK